MAQLSGDCSEPQFLVILRHMRAPLGTMTRMQMEPLAEQYYLTGDTHLGQCSLGTLQMGFKDS